MKPSRILVVGLVVGVAVNLFDFLFHGLLLSGSHAGMPIMRQDASMVSLVIADFSAAIIFVWVYSKVRACFDVGVMGGASFGLYAGILKSFPMFIFLNLLLVDYPFKLAWIMTLSQTLWCVLAGVVTGGMTGREEATA